MAVPARRKRSRRKEKGVKIPQKFINKAFFSNPISKCINCNWLKPFHYICPKCYNYNKIDFLSLINNKNKKKEKII